MIPRLSVADSDADAARAAAPPAAATLLERLDRFCDRWSEHFHPVVVKETRQSLRSWVFPAAFLSMLTLCLAGSMVLVVRSSDRLQYAELGPEFFRWHFGVLLGAVCGVTPLGLFRGVAAEFHGRTFEVLALTTLSAREIVFGKLKSATVQMGAYYFAAAPFVCFSYLLEGLSLPGVAAALLVASLAGLSACLGGLMFGSLARNAAWETPGLLATVLLSAAFFALGFPVGVGAADGLTGWEMWGEICLGLGCFAYVFLFYGLLTLGIAISQFTPTMPQLGRPIPHPPERGPGTLRTPPSPEATSAPDGGRPADEAESVRTPAGDS